MAITLDDIERAQRSGLTEEGILRAQGAAAPAQAVPGQGIVASGSKLGPLDISRAFLGRRTPEGHVEFAPEGTLPMLGEMVGGLVPGMRPVTAALGAAGGLAAESYLKKGEPPSLMSLMTEAGLSLAPEAVESAGRLAGRHFLRGTVGGQRLRFQEAAAQAREIPGAVFEPLPRENIAAMFEAVRNSGVKLDTADIAGHLRDLPSGKLDDLMGEVARIDRQNKTGGRFRQGIEQLMLDPRKLAGVDIGQLQQLSSELRKRIQALPNSYEARQLLRDFRETVDDTIFTGKARGHVAAGETPAVLALARQQYARSKAAEELGDMIENHITSSPDLSMVAFNLRGFWDELRRGRSAMSKDIARAIEHMPGGEKKFWEATERISQQYKTLEMATSDVSGFRRWPLVAGLSRMLSTVMLTPTGQALFEQAVLRGRGTVSPNLVAAIANQARRELFPTPEVEGTE